MRHHSWPHGCFSASETAGRLKKRPVSDFPRERTSDPAACASGIIKLAIWTRPEPSAMRIPISFVLRLNV